MRSIGHIAVSVMIGILAIILGIGCLVGASWIFLWLWLRLPMEWYGFLSIDPKNIFVFAVAETAFLGILVLLVSKIMYLFQAGTSEEGGSEKKGRESKRKAKSEKKSLRQKITVSPAGHNYRWQGGFSIFTWAILHVVMGLRLVSALQLCKELYREIAPSDTDAGSTRPNVPPWFQEIYILAWGVFLAVQLFLGIHADFVASVFRALDVYFIVESLTWILYYSVFRRFFEEDYSVYHVLEHLPTILFLIPLQAVAYALVCMYDGGAASVSWNKVFPVLLGQASERYVMFSMVGFIYSAIVVSMIISTFPVERVKACVPSTIIVGAGDVVKERLYGALCRWGERTPANKMGKMDVYSKETTPVQMVMYGRETEDPIRIAVKPKEIYRLIERSRKNVVVWIETPSDTHLHYLELLKDGAALVVVEKPMVCSMSDLLAIKELIASGYRRKIFFLSYYILEKALALTLLARPNRFYLKYFKEECRTRDQDGGVVQVETANGAARFYQTYLELGRMESIDVEIIEKRDRRPLPNGGQLIDTFVHHCLIASLFAGLPCTWKLEPGAYRREESADRAEITLDATGEFGERIHLYLLKEGDDNEKKRQRATLKFENGIIEADFDKRTTTLRKGLNAVILKVDENYRDAYDIQCDMVYECYFNQLDPSGFDGLYHQVEVLEWLLNLGGAETHPRHPMRR